MSLDIQIIKKENVLGTSIRQKHERYEMGKGTMMDVSKGILPFHVDCLHTKKDPTFIQS